MDTFDSMYPGKHESLHNMPDTGRIARSAVISLIIQLKGRETSREKRIQCSAQH